MISTLKLTFILVVWSLVILFLTSPKKNNYTEFFTTTLAPPLEIPFQPWGKTVNGCINRCFAFTVTNSDKQTDIDRNNILELCKEKCNNCSDSRCGWTTENVKLTIQKKPSTNFDIQYLGGDSEILIKWTYYFNNNLLDIENPEFDQKESFFLIDGDEQNIKFELQTHENKNSYVSINNENENKYVLENSLDENLNIKNWYIFESNNVENKCMICKDSEHPLNKKWIIENTENDLCSKFKKYKKIEDVNYEYKVINFVIQLINTKDPSKGIQLYNYIDDFEKNSNELDTSKVFKKRITNLERNTEFRLSIYPIILKTNIINNTQEKILGRNTSDNSDNVFVHTNDSTVINL
jgi:hypothetical protein